MRILAWQTAVAGGRQCAMPSKMASRELASELKFHGKLWTFVQEKT